MASAPGHDGHDDHDHRGGRGGHGGHGHGLPEGVTLRRGLVALVALIGVLALVGLALLWPRGAVPTLGDGATYLNATVTAVRVQTCPGVDPSQEVLCQVVDARLTSGPDGRTVATFTVPATDFRAPDLAVGSHIVVFDSGSPLPEYRYGFVDFQRSQPLWWLLGLFVLVVVALGRWQGVRALLGLAASLGVLLVFVLPALLRGSNALAVAAVGVVLVAFLALYLAHGVNTATTVALLGTLASLFLIALLAVVFVELAHLSGLADEEAQVLRVTAEGVDLQGLLLAGIVIGALGVLDDVTVTQVSAVAELRALDPTQSWRHLYGRAVRIGRDHVASTVNTLVLAYAGASLPLLLLFVEGNQSFGRVLTTEIVAAEVVRTLVGSIGLVLAVPLTTALAAVVLTRSSRATPTPTPTAPAAAAQGEPPEAERSADAPPGPRADPWERFEPEETPFG